MYKYPNVGRLVPMSEEVLLSEDMFAYYASPGPMTDPGEYAHLFDDLPTEIPALVGAVQGLLIHIYWAERYGLHVPEERGEREVNLRGVLTVGIPGIDVHLSIEGLSGC